MASMESCTYVCMYGAGWHSVCLSICQCYYLTKYDLTSEMRMTFSSCESHTITWLGVNSMHAACWQDDLLVMMTITRDVPQYPVIYNIIIMIMSCHRHEYELLLMVTITRHRALRFIDILYCRSCWWIHSPLRCPLSLGTFCLQQWLLGRLTLLKDTSALWMGLTYSLCIDTVLQAIGSL